jgi:hypothetical protein
VEPLDIDVARVRFATAMSRLDVAGEAADPTEAQVPAA